MDTCPQSRSFCECCQTISGSYCLHRRPAYPPHPPLVLPPWDPGLPRRVPAGFDPNFAPRPRILDGYPFEVRHCPGLAPSFGYPGPNPGLTFTAPSVSERGAVPFSFRPPNFGSASSICEPQGLNFPNFVDLSNGGHLNAGRSVVPTKVGDLDLPQRSLESSPFIYPCGDLQKNMEWSIMAQRLLPSRRNERLTAALDNAFLWHRFHTFVDEMIVTKRGRRLFPPFVVKVRGLENCRHYRLAVITCKADSLRYRYHKDRWIVQGPAENESFREEVFYHPDGDGSGQHWSSMENVSFKRIKLTNKIMSSDHRQELLRKCKFPPILIHTMHKYVLRLLIHEKFSSTNPQPFWNVVDFPETEFVAVTAYQNAKIKELKIESNNFARGFRPGGKRKREMDDNEKKPQELTNIDDPDVQLNL